MANTPQLNIRLTNGGRKCLRTLVEHFTRKLSDTGKPASYADVTERAYRALMREEGLKIPKND